jgi:hypothetical protein
MSSSPYTLHKKIDATTQTAQTALELAKSAHARLDVAPKVGPAGERGLKGDAGRDAVCCCKNGKDSTVAGQRGERGGDGRPGKDCVCESTSAIADAVQKLDAATTELTKHRAETAKLQADVSALIAMHKNAGLYLEWLRTRAADRIAKNDRLIASKVAGAKQ